MVFFDDDIFGKKKKDNRENLPEDSFGIGDMRDPFRDSFGKGAAAPTQRRSGDGPPPAAGAAAKKVRIHREYC